ncbi:hypothetical protein [Actinoplanes sp. M2I2]|uniref:hypothetical protein n=1 Tax=Actinoplanes sp. M2I2 TaxID=1734444 RepID=UPI0020223317|nr:hypothetical protein [Actinoplanes sp. M2I2]
MAILGPYPLCAECRKTNGGLVAVGHRQVHLRAHGKQACVDQGLKGLFAVVWAVCDTRGSCEDAEGEAYLVPTAETFDAAEDLLWRLGLGPTAREGALWFRTPTRFRLDDAGHVRHALAAADDGPSRWLVVNDRFERLRPG